MIDVTAIILTMNEEKNIEECINSLKNFAKRICVIDSGSTDKTVNIAKKMGAEVFFNKFSYYAQQFNWGLENINISTEWVMRIDADERLTDELKTEVSSLFEKGLKSDVNGLVFRLRVYFLGKWIKHGGVYPFRKIMMFKYKYGYIENIKKDSQTILMKGRSIEVKNDILHYDFKDITAWTNKHNWYATREVIDYYEFHRKNNVKTNMSNKKIVRRRKLKSGFYYRLPYFFRAKMYYIYRYYFKLGFLDGKEGKIFHYLQAYWYRFLVDTKLFEAEMTKKINTELEKLE